MRVPASSMKLAVSLIVSIFLLASVAGRAMADWSLDPARSHLAFVSIKSQDIGEVHSFREMSGTIDQEGKVQVTLMLDSVETLIPIRNERMRKMLFETANYKDAVLTAKVDPAIIDGMKPGDIKDVVAEGILSLHGAQQPMILSMLAAKVAEDVVVVASTSPLIVDAAKFGMSNGVEKLREIAGLESISNAVPVGFVMTFVHAPLPDKGENRDVRE